MNYRMRVQEFRGLYGTETDEVKLRMTLHDASDGLLELNETKWLMDICGEYGLARDGFNKVNVFKDIGGTVH